MDQKSILIALFIRPRDCVFDIGDPDSDGGGIMLNLLIRLTDSVEIVLIYDVRINFRMVHVWHHWAVTFVDRVNKHRHSYKLDFIQSTTLPKHQTRWYYPPFQNRKHCVRLPT